MNSFILCSFFFHHVRTSSQLSKQDGKCGLFCSQDVSPMSHTYSFGNIGLKCKCVASAWDKQIPSRLSTTATLKSILVQSLRQNLQVILKIQIKVSRNVLLTSYHMYCSNFWQIVLFFYYFTALPIIRAVLKKWQIVLLIFDTHIHTAHFKIEIVFQ